MRLKQPTTRSREPDLTGLINVIFLILIFFMIAGALRPFAARELKLAKSDSATSATPTPGRLIVHSNGRVTYHGTEITPHPAAITATLLNDNALDKSKRFTVIADARLDAAKALAIVSALQSAGISDIAILTERQR